MLLNWRTVTPSNDRAHLVRGTELESAIPEGFRSRFAVYSIRTVERDTAFTFEVVHQYDRRYVVRDAETVSDADVKDGKRPAIIAQFATETELCAWLDQQPKASEQ
jgi:hypothetical protein